MLVFDWLLCRKCYRVERDRQMLDIDKRNIQYYKRLDSDRSQIASLADTLNKTEFDPIITGFLGLASSIFCFLIIGSSVWFL